MSRDASTLVLVVLLDGARVTTTRVQLPPAEGESAPADAPRLALESMLSFIERRSDENDDANG